MAWRDTIVVKKDYRLRNESDYEAIGRDDNSSLLELERKTAFTRASEEKGMFAGTAFTTESTPPAQTTMLKGVSFRSPNDDKAEDYMDEEEDEKPEERVKSRGHHKSIYARLDEIVDRISGSGGSYGEREASRDSETSYTRRVSNATQPIRKMVSKLAKSTSMKSKTKFAQEDDNDDDAEKKTTQSFSDNPQFKPKDSSASSSVDG